MTSARYRPFTRSAGNPTSTPTTKQRRRRPAGSAVKGQSCDCHQDRGGVRADAEERAVPDRDLPVVAGEQVEPHRRDRRCRTPRDELVSVAVCEVGKYQPKNDHAPTTAGTGAPRRMSAAEVEHHTRSTVCVPNRPAGGTATRARMSPNGTTRSMPRSECMYCVVSAPRRRRSDRRPPRRAHCRSRRAPPPRT